MFQEPSERGPWWEELGCALLSCTWPLWLILLLWLVLAISRTDPMGG